jgi:hypothetical protein
MGIPKFFPTDSIGLRASAASGHPWQGFGNGVGNEAKAREMGPKWSKPGVLSEVLGGPSGKSIPPCRDTQLLRTEFAIYQNPKNV